jgi:hypothetical protein
MTSPLQVARLLPIANGLTAILAVALLAMGEREMRLLVSTIAVVGLSIWITDFKGWFRLNAREANIVGALALALALYDLNRFATESRLLALANLLVYLQFVLFFQQKTVTRYWYLITLGFLDVAVAAALNLSLASGVLLVLYFGSLLMTVSLLSLYYQATKLAPTTFTRQPIAAEPMLPPASQKLADGPALVPHVAGDPTAAVLGWPLVRQLSALAIGALAICAAVFLLAPRLVQTTIEEVTGSVSKTGFTETVRLGSVNRILESSEEALELRLVHHETNELYRLHDEPYLRGLVLTRYTPEGWQPTPNEAEWIQEMEPVDLLLMPELVRQEFRIGPMESNALFSVTPAINVRADPHLLFDPVREQVLRPIWYQNQRFKYSLVTTGFWRGHQFLVSPAREEPDFEEHLQVPAGETLETLQQMALAQVESIPAEDHYNRARALENFLRYSGQFSYSLALGRASPQLDPIEDFVRNGKQGNCEYFASALTLMLRQVGIPARMAVGYKGGEWNVFGRFYTVRNLHAHAWVEAYLPPDKLPAQLPPPADQWTDGGWLRLDPTPATDRDSQIADAGALSTMMYQALGFARSLWSTYVMGLDAQRQWELIYQPAYESIQALFDPTARQELWQRIVKALRGGRTGWLQGDWFNWRAGLLAMLIAGVVLGLYRPLRRVWKRLLSRTGLMRTKDDRLATIEVPFYKRYEAALSVYHRHRLPRQTQREFAQQTARWLAASPVTHEVAAVPASVVDAFYRVRFGRQALDSREQEAVEQSVLHLENALALLEQPPASPQ